MRTIRALLLGAALPLLACGAPEAELDPAAHRAEVEAWRAERDASLRQDDGWLTLVGLEWLEPGENRVGSAPGAVVRLPDRAAADLGAIYLVDGALELEPADGVEMTVGGEPVAGTVPLASDAEGEPTEIEHRDLLLYVIERGGRFAVRVKDRQSPVLAAFEGMDYYPIDPAWRIEARFEPAPPGTTIPVPDIIGVVNQEPSPGTVHFRHGSRRASLAAIEASGGRLFLVFGDETNGETTYGGGRFVYTDPPEDSRVVVDFNRAYNPPCVFTEFATCPLPPRGNDLPLVVEAGEKSWGKGH